MKKLIITILALATIALAANKPICTEVYNTDEYVEFSCEGGMIRTSTLKISKNLDSITFVGEYSNGNQFYVQDIRGKYSSESEHVRKVKDSYGITAVNENHLWPGRSMEKTYEIYREEYDFN